MPGLAGFTSRSHLSPQQLDAQLQTLKNNLTVPAQGADFDLLFGPQTAGTYIGPADQTTQTFQNDKGFIAWLDGDIFNRETLTQQHNWSIATDIELLLHIVTHSTNKNALKNIDGLFSAVVLDTNKDQLHLITDRYGLRPLYWYQDTHGLYWSSEPKAFLNLPHFSPQITAKTISFFLLTGQLPPNQTWFEGVQQVPPASHFIYHLTDGTLTRERYWWWDQVSTRVGKTNPTDLAHELGDLFQKAVAKRMSKEHGLLLSGGLDSRAIFAALPDAPPTFTFGQPDSHEVAIAKEVSAIKVAPHTILPLTQDNWLQPRIESVWWTDGLLNLMHMHGVEHFDTIAQTIRIGFNGAGGDGLAGGGHLFEPHEFSRYVTEILHLNLEQEPQVFTHLQQAFQNAGSAHAFYIDWRMRGFTIHGPRMGLFKGMDYRLPFLDNQVQAFLFGLPISLKQNNKLYRHMLIQTFPSYFKHIPWAKTGKPITWPKWAVRSSRLFKKLQKPTPHTSFTNYSAWLRQNPAQTTINALLTSKNARIHTYVSPQTLSQIWSEHLAGQDHSEQIGRYLTVELYLRQVFDNQYRTLYDTEPLF